MISAKSILTRVVACVLLALSLSACVTFGEQSVPMYYQPGLYGHQPVASYGMDVYALPR